MLIKAVYKTTSSANNSRSSRALVPVIQPCYTTFFCHSSITNFSPLILWWQFLYPENPLVPRLWSASFTRLHEDRPFVKTLSKFSPTKMTFLTACAKYFSVYRREQFVKWQNNSPYCQDLSLWHEQAHDEFNVFIKNTPFHPWYKYPPLLWFQSLYCDTMLHCWRAVIFCSP